MKNILFVHSSSELYGSDRSLLNIVRQIDKTKYRPYVILPCEGPLADLMRQIDGATVTIFEVAVLRRKNLTARGILKYCRDFNKSVKFIEIFIKKNRISIVDTNTAVVIPGAVAAKRMHVSSVWHIREIIKSSLENKVLSFLMKKYSDIIVANSKSTGAALNVPNEKVVVVYNAVAEPSDTQKIPHDGIAVGMAGRINRWKGQQLFVDAAKMVHIKMPDIVFYIAGEAYAGEEYLKADLQEYIKQAGLEGKVILLGQVGNMDKFYNSIDIFVLPSTQPEPFGLVVVEAMSHGLPVIATNHGGPTEIIDDGKDGYLVDYHDATEMAGKIIKLASNNNLRTMMSNEAMIKKRKYTVINMVKSMESIYSQLS